MKKCLFAKTCVRNMVECTERVLEVRPRSWDCPMSEAYHSELVDTLIFQGSESSMYHILFNSFTGLWLANALMHIIPLEHWIGKKIKKRFTLNWIYGWWHILRDTKRQGLKWTPVTQNIWEDKSSTIEVNSSPVRQRISIKLSPIQRGKAVNLTTCVKKIMKVVQEIIHCSTALC